MAGLAAGNYTVEVDYSGDNNFNPSSGNAVFTVDKAKPSLDVNASDIDYHDSEPITVNVTAFGDGVTPTGDVTIIVINRDGDVVYNETVPISEGTKAVQVDDLPAGEYNVTVTYNGDANYTDASAEASFTVNKINSTVDVDVSGITYGDNETIKITVPEDATGTVNITITGDNGVTVNYYDLNVNDDGTVTVTVENLTAGNYDVNVTYSGDNNYNANDKTASFNVDKATPDVSVNGTNIDYGQDDTITVNVTGKNITGNVTIYIDGNEYDTIPLTQSEDGGSVEYIVPGLSAGDHTVKVHYNGDDNHYANTAENTFTVSKVEPSMDVKTTDIYYGQVEDITVNLTAADGGSIPTGNVTIIVTNKDGDVVYNETVNLTDGAVTVHLEDLLAGEYDVAVSYSGDENYTSTEGIDKFSVGKTDSNVAVDTSDIDYKQTENIEINVTGSGAEVPTGNVTVIVTNRDGDVVYNDTVIISDGVVTVPIEGLPAGDYDVSVEYNGDNNYKRATGEADFTVAKINPTVLVNTSDIEYHDSEPINVSLDSDATGEVNIVVTDENGNVIYNDTIKLSEGNASVEIPDLPAGKYDVTVNYPGDENYKPATSETSFIVNQIDTPVNLNTDNITYGDEETISVNVNDDATGNVTIIITKDGETVLNKTVPLEDAAAELIVPELNAGNYTVHVDYSGDNNYKPNSTDGEFEVAKANATVEIHVYDIIYGDIEELTVTCNAPGTVTIYVNGAKVTLPLDNGHAHILFASILRDYSGKAQWDLENLAVGNYPARVHYNGNENYNEADDEDDFNVIKKETSITVSVDDIKVGEDAVINVELSPGAAPGKITITVDGKEYNVTHENGKAVLKVHGLKAGEHTVTVSYPGSQNYTDSSNETTFTVSKVKPEIDTSAPTIKVGEDGKITVTVPKDATGKITIEIDGKNYTAEIKDGKAVFTVSGLKVGKHPIKVYYSGDDKYESAIVDGGDLEVIDDGGGGQGENGQGQKGQDHKTKSVDLSVHATGNPVLALLLVLAFLGFIPLGRKKRR